MDDSKKITVMQMDKDTHELKVETYLYLKDKDRIHFNTIPY